MNETLVFGLIYGAFATVLVVVIVLAADIWRRRKAAQRLNRRLNARAQPPEEDQ